VPLIIEVGNADIMATLLQIKADVEEQKGTRINMVFFGASEAHLLAQEIGELHASFPHGRSLTDTLGHSERWSWCYFEPSETVPC
jgi:hypothetical protein